MDFEKAVVEARNNNFNFIEIHSLWGKTIEDLSDNEVEDVKNMLKVYDMKVSCFSSTLFLMCPLYTTIDQLEPFNQSFLTYNGTYENHIEKLKRSLEICNKLNINYMRIFPFRRELKIEKKIDEIVDDISERFYGIARIAEKANIIVVVENCPHTYLPKGVLTQKVIKNINSKNLGLLWDVGNSYRTLNLPIPEKYKEISLNEEYKIIKDTISYIHLKDYKKVNKPNDMLKYEHITFGRGDIRYKDIINTFKKR